MGSDSDDEDECGNGGGGRRGKEGGKDGGEGVNGEGGDGVVDVDSSFFGMATVHLERPAIDDELSRIDALSLSLRGDEECELEGEKGEEGEEGETKEGDAGRETKGAGVVAPGASPPSAAAYSTGSFKGTGGRHTARPVGGHRAVQWKTLGKNFDGESDDDDLDDDEDGGGDGGGDNDGGGEAGEGGERDEGVVAAAQLRRRNSTFKEKREEKEKAEADLARNKEASAIQKHLARREAEERKAREEENRNNEERARLLRVQKAKMEMYDERKGMRERG